MQNCLHHSGLQHSGTNTVRVLLEEKLDVIVCAPRTVGSWVVADPRFSQLGRAAAGHVSARATDRLDGWAADLAVRLPEVAPNV